MFCPEPGTSVAFHPSLRNAQDAVQNLRLAIGEKFMGASHLVQQGALLT